MVKLIFPVNYIGITQEYKSSHKAIDLGWSKSHGGPNHEIVSPGDGIVTYVKNNYNKTDKTYVNYGNYIKIDHGGGITTLVAHLKYNSAKVKVGDKVKRGDVIGIMGSTGYSTGIHCHYEVIINKEKVNPINYTYYDSNQIVGTNTMKKYNIKILEKGDSMEDNNIPIESAIDDIIFEYVCSKTGMYKIQLNENEKLVIKD